MFFKKAVKKTEEKIVFRPLVVRTWGIEEPHFQCGIQYWKNRFRIVDGRVFFPALPQKIEGEVAYVLDRGDWQDHLIVRFKEEGGFETSFSFWTGVWDPSESELFERFLKEFACSLTS